ncbi:SDR family NAD(P)-dependent oxidoreductase [Streptomyces sp. NPDC053048]|uniref:SDR family NAD(P)-dependent oxidoreductase n=1 Tax=Streptomyces sp. NPDC053048 TaxID=3365694 RepID=UPI0037CE50E4
MGTACRLPGGIHNPGALWKALSEGRDLVTEVPPERFDHRQFVEPGRRRPGRSYTAAGGFLDDITGFDADFFGISPREAARMDPQQRLLLEVTAEALDDAGVCHDRWAGSGTGVFVGVSSRDFGELQTTRPQTLDAHTMTGLASAITANRISHAFDWRGESIAVDTACSSSLTALHRACAFLRAGGGPAALAGGVNVLINPFGYAGFSAASMLSPTGRCRPFSADADGFARAEGVVVVLLKRLADALADGDRVHATILATGTNCDGRTRGLALPSSTAQQALLERVYGEAGIDPDDVVYLEAHGTGTPAGDPVECEAIGRALGVHRTAGALPIGSVKSNLGHMEAGSGLAGLLKALLVLRHRTVPPTLHAEPFHAGIDFDGLRLRPAVRCEPLAERSSPVVGVNNFGFGGANAHVVLAPGTAPQAPVALPLPPRPGRPLPVVASAHTRSSLVEAAQRMAGRLRSAPAEEFYDLAHAACLRRTLHEHRVAVLATGPTEAAEGLAAAADGRRGGGTAASGRAEGSGTVAFVFSGNGSQWAGMGAGLLRDEPVFREAVRRHDALLRPLLGWSVLDELAAPVTAEALRRTEVAQPLLYAVQMGLSAVLEEQGVRPAGVVGHSVGEIAAACVAGVLDAGTAARVVAARSQAQAPTAGQGRMAAVGLPEDAARTELRTYDGLLTVAAVNSPRDVTLAGDVRALAELGERLTARSVFFRMLDLDYAFHSPAMDPVEKLLRAALGDLRPTAGNVPFASCVTGGLLSGERLDTTYWWRNVREPVLFGAAAQALLGAGCEIFVEVGPHPVTATYLTRLGRPGGGRVPVVRTCSREGDGTLDMRRAVAQLLAHGARVDWRAHFPVPGRPVDLPARPWERERHWNGAPWWWTTGQDAPAPLAHPLLGTRLPSSEPSWSGPLERSRLPWLGDHRVGESVVLPATAYLEAAFAAAGQVFDGPVEVLGLRILRALDLPWDDDSADVRLQVSLSDEDQVFRFAARHETGPDWHVHARGRVRRLLRPAPGELPDGAGKAGRVLDGQEHYALAGRAGLPYGPAFRVLRRLTVGEGEAIAEYAAVVEGDDFRAHPAVLDGALQACLPLVAQTCPDGTPFLPSSVDAVRLWRPAPTAGRVHARVRETGATEICCDVRLADPKGRVAVELEGVRLRRLPATAAATISYWDTMLRARAHPLLPHPAAEVPVPAPRALAEAVAHRRTATGAADRDRQEYARFVVLRKSMAALTAAAVGDLLGAPATTEPFTLADMHAAGLRPDHTPLMEVLLDLCTEHGLLSPADNDAGRAWRWRPGVVVPPPSSTVSEALRAYPEMSFQVLLYGRCGLHLTDLLRGARDARELLFAEADRQIIDQCYERAPCTGPQVEAAREALRTVVAGWPADRPLRVLEVGAGTGALTRALLGVLPEERTEYVFTDVSPVFFPRARKHFAGRGFLDCRLLDLDGDPQEQGFRPGEFDVVVAHDTLHVAQDVRRATGRLAGLLADGGLLVATEIHDTPLTAACFGLLEEFWTRTDTTLRPTSPLLDADRWEDVFRGCGFDSTARLDWGAPAAPPVTSVLLARRPAPAAGGGPAAAPVPLPDTRTRWIVAAERPESARARELASLLTESGAPDVRLTAIPSTPGEWDAAWRQPGADPGPLHVVCLLDDEQPADAEAVNELAVRRVAGLAGFAQAMATGDAVAALWLVTGSGAALPAPAMPGREGDAAPWAAARCLTNEHPSLTVRRVAVQEGVPVRRLALELLAPTDEDDEVLLTCDGRFVGRAWPVSTARPPARPSPYRCEVREPGLAHRVTWTHAVPPVPGPDGVLIAVRAAGLNYRDAMESAGLLRPGPASVTPTGQCPGLECAGVVAAVGTRVTGLAPGDRVYALAPRSLASHVVADRRLAGRMPDGMDFAAAATLPVVFLTVRHGLERLARLSAGETLLVHGAAGGVGLAALQHARACGAAVIATAGTPAKRDLLRLMGVEHVLDSRGADFGERVRELTGGRGVDVVLNSLAGEALVRSAELLRPGGRFVELGRRDIDADSRLPMSLFDRSISFFAVDLNRLLHAESVPEEVLSEVGERFHDGTYHPLPYQAYPAGRLPEALDALRHSRHIGKVVVTFDEPPPMEPSPVPRPEPEAAYLVTGGLTGLGAAVARHLASRGARHLVLAGRRGGATPGAGALVRELAAQGTEAEVHAVDLCDREAVARIVRDVAKAGRRLRGIVHAAAAFDDAPLVDLTEERIRAVLRPKVLGALSLDTATAAEPLDFFVCFSSGSAAIGNRHQANYAAANLVLEALARSRRAAGRPWLAVAWGAIGDTGHAAREGFTDVLRRAGLGAMTSQEACAVLDGLLATDVTTVVAGRFDWARAAAHFPGVDVPRFAAMVPRDGREKHDGPEPLRLRLLEAGPDDALELVAGVLVQAVADVLETDPSRVDRRRPLDQLGLDSLMAAELVGVVTRRLGCEIPAVELVNAGGVDALAVRALARLGQRPGADAQSVASTP